MSWKSAARFLRRIDVRLTLYHACCVLLLSGLCSAFLYFRLGHELRQKVSVWLRHELAELQGATGTATDPLATLSRELSRQTGAKGLYELSGRVLSKARDVVLSSPGFPEIPCPRDGESLSHAILGHATLETFQIPGRAHSYRVCTAPATTASEPAYVVQLAIDLEPVDRALESFLGNVAVILPALLLVSIGIGCIITRQALGPVDRISIKAREITASRLDERLPKQDTDDELDRLADTLNMMLERLEKSFERMSQFSTDVAHELRTPISTLRASAEVMAREPRGLAEYQDFCEVVLAEAERLTTMINDMYTLYRSETGREGRELTCVSVRDLLREVATTLQDVAEVKNVALTWQADGDAMAEGDQPMLRRLFGNLIDNAIKYTPSGGRVAIDMDVSDGEVSVRITDTGAGISEDELPQVFERFWRADQSRSRDTGGVGLGLSIARSIAELHHGSITAESQVGRGSCFTVRLPLCDVEPRDEAW